MRKPIALLLAAAIMAALLCCAPVYAARYDDYERVDLLDDYTSEQVINMYPEVSAYLAEQLRALNEDISLRNFNIELKYIDAIYFSVLCENPDIFYVNPKFFDSTMTAETEYIVSVRPIYLFEIADIPAEIEKFENTISKYLGKTDSKWDDFTKVRYLHDLIATTCEYDTKDYTDDMFVYTSYGALVKGVAVCEGYTLAYRLLLSRLGIETHYISSPEMQHAWTLVKLGGSYYHVDITRDDPSNDSLGRVCHNHCLKSDRAFAADGDHKSWVSDIKASDTRYDNEWWHTIETMFFPVETSVYYVDQIYGSSIYGALIEHKSDGTMRVAAKVTTRWMNRKMGDNTFWERSFVFPAYDGTYFYYNDTNCVYRQLPTSYKANIIYKKTGNSAEDIYGIAFNIDGKLSITLKDNPNIVDKKKTLQSLEPSDKSVSVNSIQESDGRIIGDITPANATKTVIPSAPADSKPIIEEQSSKLSLYVGQPCTLTTDSTGVVFGSDNPEIARISNSGKITAVKKGTTTIRARGDTISLVVKVTVKNPKLSVTKKTLKRGKSYTLSIKGRYGKTSFKSSKKKVATVSQKGKIMAKKRGKTTITVKVGKVKLLCKITVK